MSWVEKFIESYWSMAPRNPVCCSIKIQLRYAENFNYIASYFSWFYLQIFSVRFSENTSHMLLIDFSDGLFIEKTYIESWKYWNESIDEKIREIFWKFKMQKKFGCLIKQNIINYHPFYTKNCIRESLKFFSLKLLFRTWKADILSKKQPR